LPETGDGKLVASFSTSASTGSAAKQRRGRGRRPDADAGDASFSLLGVRDADDAGDGPMTIFLADVVSGRPGVHVGGGIARQSGSSGFTSFECGDRNVSATAVGNLRRHADLGVRETAAQNPSTTGDDGGMTDEAPFPAASGVTSFVLFLWVCEHDE
jgi:hypothetical protein